MLTFQQILAIVQLLTAFNVDPTTTANVRAVLEAQQAPIVQTIPTTTAAPNIGGTAAETQSIRVISWNFGVDKQGNYVDVIADTELALISVKNASSSILMSDTAVLNNKYSDGNLHYFNRFKTSDTPSLVILEAKNGAVFTATK